MIKIMLFSNSTGSLVTNFTVKGGNSTKKISGTAYEQASGAIVAPSRCRCRHRSQKWLPTGGGLRLALPPASVGMP